jgi:hypothetical protein
VLLLLLSGVKLVLCWQGSLCYNLSAQHRQMQLRQPCIGSNTAAAAAAAAGTFLQAAELVASVVPQAGRSSEWHFCRGVLDSSSNSFRSFQELGEALGLLLLLLHLVLLLLLLLLFESQFVFCCRLHDAGFVLVMQAHNIMSGIVLY